MSRYVSWVTLAAGAGGLGISIYLTFVHFSAAQLVCTVGGPINCERVLGSGYAVIAGSSVPTSAAGIVWFGISAALAAAMLLGAGRYGQLRAIQIAWSVVGLLTVVYLLFVEIVLVGALCLWCTTAHALVVVIFVLTVTLRSPSLEPNP